MVALSAGSVEWSDRELRTAWARVWPPGSCMASTKNATSTWCRSVGSSAMLKWLNPEVDLYHQKITDGDEHIELIYEPAVELPSGKKEIQDHFQTALERVREREIRLGMTLVGPHRDEVLLTVNERNIRTFGSQGQQRTAAIALKLAAARLLENKRGEQPILLLDDVFAELDVDRTRLLFEQFREFGQLFIATAKEGDLAGCGGHLNRTMISGGAATPV